MLNDVFLELLNRLLGRNLFLMVVQWSNRQKIQRSSSIPAMGLAFDRMQAAVVAHRTDWVASGTLAIDHFALVVPDPSVHVEALLSSLERFGTPDPWNEDNFLHFEVLAVVASLENSIEETFRGIDRLFREQETVDSLAGSPERIENWLNGAKKRF